MVPYTGWQIMGTKHNANYIVTLTPEERKELLDLARKGGIPLESVRAWGGLGVPEDAAQRAAQILRGRPGHRSSPSRPQARFRCSPGRSAAEPGAADALVPKPAQRAMQRTGRPPKVASSPAAAPLSGARFPRAPFGRPWLPWKRPYGPTPCSFRVAYAWPEDNLFRDAWGPGIPPCGTSPTNAGCTRTASIKHGRWLAISRSAMESSERPTAVVGRRASAESRLIQGTGRCGGIP